MSRACGFLHAEGEKLASKRSECVKLPGSSASSIRVPALLNSLPRLLLQTKCCFQGFLQSLVSTHGANDAPTSSASSSAWPMPIPYPEVFSGGAAARVAKCHLKRLTCLQVAVFNWLCLGCPRLAPSVIRMGARLSALQWSAVRMLEHLAVDGNTPEFVDAGDMGRSAGKVEDLEDHLSVLSRAFSDLHGFEGGYWAAGVSKPDAEDGEPLRCGEAVGRSEKEAVINAKPLVAERLHFPAAPSFDPVPYFDESTASRYEKPRSLGKKPDDLDERPPPVQIRADNYNKLALFKKLADTGRLKMIPHDSFYANYRSGMFSVVKDQLRDRLILDGRPANMLDQGQSKWCKGMASASSITNIFLADDRDLVICGEDLKDFFYQFVVNEERTCRNALACELSVSECRLVFGDVPTHLVRKGKVCVGFSSLAMGDVCAVEYAQCSHLSLLLQKKVCHPGELLTLKGAVPRGLLQVGIIVDDLVILEQVLRGGIQDCEAHNRCMLARSAYSSVGLENNPKKAIEKATLARFWGVEVDGKKGLVRCSSLRLWPISAITLRVIRLGLSTVGLLEALAGSRVALLGVRRRLFSILDIIFEPLSIKDQKTVIRLSDDLISELMVTVVVGSLAVVNLRSKAAPFVAATDASGSWMAGVRADIPEGVAVEAFRHVIRKGVWSKLLPPMAARDRMHGLLLEEDELPGPDDKYNKHPLWSILARSLRYRETWRQEVRRPQHINVLELRAHLLEEKRISRRLRSRRVLFGLDSQVCIGAVVKGRAAIRALNYELKKSIPWAISSDIYSGCMYFQSGENRADGPTRHRDPDPPDAPVPSWFDDVAAGTFESFDRWMLDNGAPSLNEDLPFQDISGFDGASLTPNSRVRKNRKHVSAPKEVPRPDRKVTFSLSTFGDEAVEILSGFNENQFLYNGSCLHVDCKGSLDLYSGCYGVAKEMLKHGAPWVLTFEIKRSFSEDLLDKNLQHKVLRLIQLKVFGTAFAAPICSSFSVAITPPVRSRRYPRGKPGLRASMRLKVARGNQHSDFVASVVIECELASTVYGVENPDTSWLWRQVRWKRFYAEDHAEVFRLCFCRFGTAWKKPTRIATDSCLKGRTMWCHVW